MPRKNYVYHIDLRLNFYYTTYEEALRIIFHVTLNGMKFV
jgi:hypothetical protein